MYLEEMIEERRKAVDKEERHDLLTNLIRGAEEDGMGGRSKLSAEELMG